MFTICLKNMNTSTNLIKINKKRCGKRNKLYEKVYLSMKPTVVTPNSSI